MDDVAEFADQVYVMVEISWAWKPLSFNASAQKNEPRLLCLVVA